MGFFIVLRGFRAIISVRGNAEREKKQNIYFLDEAGYPRFVCVLGNINKEAKYAY